MKYWISRVWSFVGSVNFKFKEENIMLRIKKVINLAIVLAISMASLTGQDVGDDAPQFSFQSLTGDTVKLSDYQGKVVFLFLFGNGCSNCKLIGNDTETKVEQVYGDRDDFQALGLDTWNSTSSVTTVTAFQSTTKITYPLLLKAGDIEQAYSTTYDRVIVIDQEGKIRHKGGTVVYNDLDNAITVIEGLFSTTSTGELGAGDDAPVSAVFPNPVDDKTSIRISLDKQASVDIRVYNLTGREILNLGTEMLPSGSHVREIPARDLSSGVYMLRTSVSGQVYTSKMVVR
jgi:peroxiredoxin